MIRNVIILINLMIMTSCSFQPSFYGSFVDDRDGHEYRYIKLGQQIWMSQNLDFSCSDSWYNLNDSIKYSKFGRVYKIETARKVCPNGWHLPSEKEWEDLEIATVLCKQNVKQDGWRGKNASGFLNGGKLGFDVFVFDESYAEATNEAEFWTSTLTEYGATYTRIFSKVKNGICKNQLGADLKASVRCIKNDTILIKKIKKPNP